MRRWSIVVTEIRASEPFRDAGVVLTRHRTGENTTYALHIHWTFASSGHTASSARRPSKRSSTIRFRSTNKMWRGRSVSCTTPRPKRADHLREEADWWASAAGRNCVKGKSSAAQAKGIKSSGSSLVAYLNKKRSTQIALRLPGADIEEARKIAGRRGIGYQTLLKMIVHEGLQRENRRG
jgi:hypothetical protein